MFTTEKPTLSRDIPFQDEIQRAFGGGHSLDDVQALAGPGIASTASDLGAIAFTQGNVMGFAQEPTLHDAAHEAAHVFQQRAGLPLFEGFADHEAHADAVADRVVAGQSAGDLLPSGGTASTAVQCKKESGAGSQAPTPPQPTAPEGLHAADPKVVAALEARMKQADDLQGGIELAKWGAALLPAMNPAWAKTAEAMAAAANSQLVAQRNSIIQDTMTAYGINSGAADVIRYSSGVPGDAAAITHEKGQSPVSSEKDKSVIRIGDDAFHSPDKKKQNSVAYLAAVIDHEAFHAHEQMSADGKWFNTPGKDKDSDLMDEVDAYENELTNSDIYGLSATEKYEIQNERNRHIFQLSPDKQATIKTDLFKYKDPG